MPVFLGKGTKLFDIGGRHTAPASGLKSLAGRVVLNAPPPKADGRTSVSWWFPKPPTTRGVGESQKDPSTYATAYYRFERKLRQVDIMNARYEVALRG